MNLAPPIATLTREYYTREELAELLRVSIRTVDEWIARRQIAYLQKGRNVRFAREAVAQFLLENTVMARHGGMQHGSMTQSQASVLRLVLEPVVRQMIEQLKAPPVEEGKAAA